MALWNRNRARPRRVDRLHAEGQLPWYGHLKSSQVRWQLAILLAFLAGMLLIVGVESVVLGPITEAEIEAFVVDLRNGVEI